MYGEIKKYLNKQYDKTIKDLLHEVGLKTERKGYTHYNFLYPNDILKDTGYKIVYEVSIINDNDRISLYHENEDDRISGYEFEVKIKDNTIKVNRKKLNKGDF